MKEETIGTILHSGPHSFEWSKLHLPVSQTNALRHQYDTLGSTALENLQALAKTQGLTNDPRKRPDLYQLLADNHDNLPDLQKFWTQLHTVPEWVNWEQLERGQRFFYRYAAANLMGFALQGFVGENSSSVSCMVNRSGRRDEADGVLMISLALWKSLFGLVASRHVFFFIACWKRSNGFCKLPITSNRLNLEVLDMYQRSVCAFSMHQSVSGFLNLLKQSLNTSTLKIMASQLTILTASIPSLYLVAIICGCNSHAWASILLLKRKRTTSLSSAI